jgi:Ribbon-helix-helix protein, copG family
VGGGPVSEARGRGRPAVGERVSVRIPADLLAQIDAAAKMSGMTRAAMIRRTLSKAAKDWEGWLPT